MIQQPQWQTLHPTPYALGESPFWHPKEHLLYWVDISGKKILRARADGEALQAWDMPSEPGCIAPAQDGGLVVALRQGVFRVRRWGGALELVTVLPYPPATVRANDGKCDALGRFWVGTLDEPKTHHAGRLFSIDARPPGPPRVQCQAADALTGNGLAWAPDNRTVYWADTSRHIVHAWDYDLQSNALTAQRLFLQFPHKPAGWTFQDDRYRGRPDGAAVDAQGDYWVTMYEGARVCQFSADGTLRAQYAIPAQCPTMPSFGGPDGKTLFVTTARHGRSAAELAQYPQSGCVFFMRVAVPGLGVNFYADV